MPVKKSFGFGEFRAVVPVVKELVEQSHKWDIKTIFVAGSSAQPFAFLFRQIWMAKFTEPLPHFLALGESPLKNTQWKERLTRFCKKNIQLKNLPSIVLDEYALTGETIRCVQKEVQKNGFRSVKTAVLAMSPYSIIKPDFVGARSKHSYTNRQEKKAVEYIGNFAGQRSDILGMAKERRNPLTMYAHGESLTEGKAFLKDFRVRSRAAAKKYRSRAR